MPTPIEDPEDRRARRNLTRVILSGLAMHALLRQNDGNTTTERGDIINDAESMGNDLLAAIEAREAAETKAAEAARSTGKPLI